MGQVRVSVSRLRLVSGRYFWRPVPALRKLGFENEALGADPTKAIERATALNARVERELKGLRPEPLEGTLAALCRLYQNDEAYEGLKLNTKRQYLGIMAAIEKTAGDIKVASITRKDLKQTYRGLLSRGMAMAAAHMRVWRILLGFAVDEGWISINPATRLKVRNAPARTQIWKRSEVESFCAFCRSEGAASVALAVWLAYDIGQRQMDVLRLRWTDWDGDSIALTQMKTGERVRVPVSPETALLLKDVPRSSTCIVTDERHGKPYGEHVFRQRFKKLRAKGPTGTHLTFHDLRRTALTEAGSSGSTDAEIMALSGHRDRKSVSVYVRPTSDQAQRAQDKRRNKWQKPQNR
jgi:integrase